MSVAEKTDLAVELDEEVVVFPVSFAQQRWWFLEQLHPGHPAYLVPRAVALSGELSVAHLAAGLAGVVERHEVLRTGIETAGGEPVQVISDEVALSLPVVDLASLAAPEREAQGRRLAVAESRRPFIIERPPLLRATLVRLSEREHLLVLVCHHLVSDAWSTGILIREVSALYRAAVAGSPSPLPPLPLQYADFAHWQREALSEEVLAHQVDYWRRRLADLPELELPADRPPGTRGLGRGAVHSLLLEPPLAAELAAAGRRRGATPFMALLAGLAVLLGRYGRQDDLAVGSPVARREQPELEGLIGFFINTLVLRVDLAGDPTFDELLVRVRRHVLEDYEHQELPFEKLVEELAPQRQLESTPFFRVAFSMLDAPGGEARLPGLSLRPVDLGERAVQFALILFARHLEEGLALSLVYDTALFDNTTVRRLAGHFERLLAAAADHPGRRLSELPLLDSTRHHQLLVEWNDTRLAVPRAACAQELIAARAARAPEALAVAAGASGDGARLSYAELADRAGRLARALRALGVGAETRVALCLERSLATVVGVVGALEAGAAFVPIDPDFNEERLAHVLADADARVLVSQAWLRARLPPIDVPVLYLDAAGTLPAGAPAADGSERPAPRTAAENAAYVIYTSGSTGRPKGVVVEHRQLVSYTLAVLEAMAVEPPFRAAIVNSIAADLPLQLLFSALFAGGSVHVMASDRVTDAERLGDDFARHRVDVLKIVPSHLTALLSSANAARVLPRRLLVTGGEASSWDLVDRCRELAPGCAILNHYGPTETTVGVTTWPVADQHPGNRSATVPIGRPLGNSRVYVVDRRLGPALLGAPGELVIAGANVARGYFRRPGQTAERYLPDPFAALPGGRLYRTGDRVRWLARGVVEYLDRIDRQIKIRGFRVEPGEIEAVLAEHAGVFRCVVEARRDPAGDARLVAYVVAAPAAVVTKEELRDFLRPRLPAPMRPAAFVLLETLPYTVNGKVDREALPEPETERSAARVAPRNRVEQELAELWEELLGVRPVGVRDDFFDLGGHSLLAVRLMARVHGRFGRKLPLAALFHSSTVEDLARLLGGQEEQPAASPLVLLTPAAAAPAGGDTGEPLFLVHPAGGNVFCYRELAGALGGRPVYGLQAVGLDAGEEPADRVEEMADRYLQAVRGVQGEGPYRLGGWSFGGLVAYEMASRLLGRGDEVAALILLDVRAGAVEGREADAKTLVSAAFEELGCPPPAGDHEDLPADELLVRLVDDARRARALPPEFTADDARRYLRTYQASQRARADYRPPAYPGRVTLFRAAERGPAERIAGLDEDETLGWGDLAAEVEVRVAAGRHEDMLYGPRTEELGRLIRARLAR